MNNEIYQSSPCDFARDVQTILGGWGFWLGLASYISLIVQKSIRRVIEVKDRWMLSSGQGE